MTPELTIANRLPSLKSIWKLTWPVLLLSFVERLAGMYEGVLLSISNPQDLAVINLCSPYYALLTTVASGLAIGINAAAGSMVGTGEWQTDGRNAVKEIVKLLLICSVLLCLVIAALMPFSFPAPEASGLYPLGLSYMLPILIGSPALFLHTALVSLMQGLGHTKAGMWMTFVSAPLNLLLSALFYPAIGILGLGLSILVCKSAGCVLGLILYHRQNKDLPVQAGQNRKRTVSKKILRLCIPASLSKAVSPLASILLNGLMLSLGTTALSADGLGRRFELFFYIAAVALSPVTISLISRCKEQNDPLLLRHLSGRLVYYAVMPSVILYATAAIFAEQIWTYLTPDPALQAAGVLYLRIFGASYPLIAADMSFASILNGLGTSMPMLLCTILRMWIVTLPLAALSNHLGWGPQGIWWALFFGNVAAAAFSGISLLRRLKQFAIYQGERQHA